MLGTCGISDCLSVGASSRSDCQDVDHPVLRPSIEKNSPLPDSESPKTLRSTKAFRIPIRESPNRHADAFLVFAAELAEGLHGSGADLDPPLA